MSSRPHRLLTWSCLVSCLGLFGASGCFEDPLSSLTNNGDESGDGDSGDGDGDAESETRGDGDGDSGDGDGDSGDGDGDSGDGDGDSGDGDGDGDGDCGPEEMNCGGVCINTKTDSHNCGVCGMNCPAFSLCGEGMCKPEKYVFVTSGKYQGNFGIQEADNICSNTAVEAMLPGIYKAWVSTLDKSPSMWMLNDAVFRLRGDDDLVVAYSRSQLYSGALAAPINRTETGNPLGSDPACNNSIEFPVWTSTSDSGNPNGPDCVGWTSNQDSSTGSIGNAGSDKDWTTGNGCTESCSRALPLYCIQQ